MARATRPPEEKTATDRIQEVIGDVDKARQSAQGEARTRLDHAAERLRELASDVRERTEDEVREFQESLDRASEHLRVELGLRAIRAQSSTEALTKLSAEIRKRKAELTK